MSAIESLNKPNPSLDRLTKIKDKQTFTNWFHKGEDYSIQLSDIKEVVALAKANQQQPSIDAMRFEAAKAAMQGMLANSGDWVELGTRLDLLYRSISIGDLLIAKLKKSKL